MEFFIIVFMAAASITGNIAMAEDKSAFDFENSALWHTSPPEFPELMQRYHVTEADLWCSQEYRSRSRKMNHAALSQLDSGLKQSSSHVRQGKYSGKWAQHERYPTIATHNVPTDWSSSDSLVISIYSEAATGEKIYIGALSDNPDTPWKDFYFHPFTVDWKGWKRLQLPFFRFTMSGQPTGWRNINGLYFFSAAFGCTPHPYSALYLDDIKLNGKPFCGSNSPTQYGDRDESGFIYYNWFKKHSIPDLNHHYLETSETAAVIGPYKFISHQPYFRAESDLFRYYPKFNPGYPSFDPHGKAYISSGDLIQWRDDNGNWTSSNLRPFLTNWAKQQGWKGIKNVWGAQGAHPFVRFDNSGDAYVLAQVEALNAEGKTYSWRTRGTLLLHSRDKLKSWSVYKLPGRRATFEKLDGHNQDCLKRPPVILLCDYRYFPDADQGNYILVPEKKPDGTLDISHPVCYSHNAIDVNAHSGDGNMALTVGGKVYIVWGWSPTRQAYRKIADRLTSDGSNIRDKWQLKYLLNTPLARTLPDIPANHPGLKLVSDVQNDLPQYARYHKLYSRDGVPTFITPYDIKTRKLGKSLYIGSGGGHLDSHNWPAITIDGNGIFHVLINGHHNPAVYTHTLKPYNISTWSAPKYVIPGAEQPRLSYATLNCDRNNILYSVHRSTSEIYNNRLSLFRKLPGKPWEIERTMVAPAMMLYTVWYQRMSYDSLRDRLFLTWFSHPRQKFMSRDMFEFEKFRYPEQEIKLYRNIKTAKGDNSDPIPLVKQPKWNAWTHGIMFNPDAGDIVTVYSTDSGINWKLAVTDAFPYITTKEKKADL